MTKEELIELAKNRPVTQKEIDAFAERCREREKEFQEWEDSQRVTNEWLNREYTI